MPISQRENDLAKAIEAAAEYRDRLHNLDLRNKDHLQFYQQQLLRFLVGNEARYKYAYDDKDPKKRPIKKGVKVEGNITIGIGFNMSRGEAKEEWNRALREQYCLRMLWMAKSPLPTNRYKHFLIVV